MQKHFFKDQYLDTTDLDLIRRDILKYDSEKLSNFDELLDSNLVPIIKSKILNKNFLKKITKNLNSSNFIFLNRVKIQKNKREYNKTWHKDSGRKNQFKILSKKNNLLFKIGIYFQDNDKQLGGGIDIIKPLNYVFFNKYNFFSNFLRKIYYSYKIRFSDNFLDIKSGEIVGFSGLVFHQTTTIKKHASNQLKDRLSIYFLIANESLVKEVIAIHNKENPSQLIELNENIEKIKFNNEEFKVCNSKMTRILEEVLSD